MFAFKAQALVALLACVGAAVATGMETTAPQDRSSMYRSLLSYSGGGYGGRSDCDVWVYGSLKRGWASRWRPWRRTSSKFTLKVVQECSVDPRALSYTPEPTMSPWNLCRKAKYPARRAFGVSPRKMKCYGKAKSEILGTILVQTFKTTIKLPPSVNPNRRWKNFVARMVKSASYDMYGGQDLRKVKKIQFSGFYGRERMVRISGRNRPVVRKRVFRGRGRPMRKSGKKGGKGKPMRKSGKKGGKGGKGKPMRKRGKKTHRGVKRNKSSKGKRGGKRIKYRKGKSRKGRKGRD